ncbi:MAG: hypothetical protein PVF27_08260 [Gemmatimonadales bacterium]|jgi:phosphatidate cytidylyltransferase
MFGVAPKVVLLVLLAAVSVGLAADRWRRGTTAPPLRYLWVFLLILSAMEWVGFTIAIWVMALFAFRALREYFSLVDIRLADRWGIWGAYLSIPFMIYLIQIDWYGLFIISIPVYAFLIVPFLVVLGGPDARGAVLSIGIVDFGLFLFVYCMGHIGYLALYSVWMAAFFVLSVALTHAVDHILRGNVEHGWRPYLVRFAVAAPLGVALSLGLLPLTTFPIVHALVLGGLIPALVLIGTFTIKALETDLGISEDDLHAGRGGIIHGTRAYLFAAPIVFHYIRYFVF